MYSAQDAGTVGTELLVDNYGAIKAYCDATPACIGMSVGTDFTQWRAFSGVKWADAVGKVRVVGEAIATYDASLDEVWGYPGQGQGQGASQPN